VIGQVVFGMHCDLKRFSGPSHAAMFNSLTTGSSPVEVPIRLFQRTNLLFPGVLQWHWQKESIFHEFGSQAVSMHVLNSGDSR
jgi:hypothetical protein